MALGTNSFSAFCYLQYSRRGHDKNEQERAMSIFRNCNSSLVEARTQIYIGIEIGYLLTHIAKPWLRERKDIAAMISGLMRSINN